MSILPTVLRRFACDFASKQSRIIYKEFANRTIVVTGAGDGIGKGIANRLAEQKATVIAVSRSAQKLDAKSSHYVPIAVDLSEPANIDAVMNDIVGEKPEFLVNCAGTSIAVNGRDNFLNLDYAGLRQVHSANFESAFYLSQQVCRYWRDNNIAGRIVNVSSAATKCTLAEHMAYITSKCALDGLTKTMAKDLGEYGIRVNSVHPTVTMTPMAYKVWYEEDRATPTQAGTQLLSAMPMGRFLQVDEVVDLVFFLLSDSATMVHGQLISIDGGLTC